MWSEQCSPATPPLPSLFPSCSECSTHTTRVYLLSNNRFSTLPHKRGYVIRIFDIFFRSLSLCCSCPFVTGCIGAIQGPLSIVYPPADSSQLRLRCRCCYYFDLESPFFMQRWRHRGHCVVYRSSTGTCCIPLLEKPQGCLCFIF